MDVSCVPARSVKEQLSFTDSCACLQPGTGMHESDNDVTSCDSAERFFVFQESFVSVELFVLETISRLVTVLEVLNLPCTHFFCVLHFLCTGNDFISRDFARVLECSLHTQHCV